MEGFSYPLDSDWSTEEIIIVVNCLNAVEQAYIDGVTLRNFQENYMAFKQIVTSISGEKQLDKRFKAESGYSLYQVVKQMKELLKEGANPTTLIKIK